MTAAPGAGEESVTLSLLPGRFGAAAAQRLVAAMAARAALPLDRLSDAVLVVDAVLAGTEGALDGERVSLRVLPAHGELRIEVGPLVAGGGRRIVERTEVPGLGAVLDRLADCSVRASADNPPGEVLELRIAARERGLA